MVAIQKFKHINGKTRTSIIRIIKFSRYKLYLPLLNDAILCQWHYYIPNFKFLAPPSTPLPPRTITTTPSINWNWEMLIISNYYKPPVSDFNMKCQPLYYLPPPLPSPSAIRVLSIDSGLKPKFRWHHINWFNFYLIYTWGLTSYKFTKNHKEQIYHVQVQSLTSIPGGGREGDFLVRCLLWS